MSPPRELLQHVLAVVRDLPAGTVAALASALAEAHDWSRMPTLAGTSTPMQAWHALWRTAAADGRVSPARVADLLRGAAAMEAEWCRWTSLEVTWTGPTPPLSSLRRTEQALLEVIDAAQSELWVVSFAAYRISSVCSALVAAAERGCRVRLLLESEAESGGKLSSGGVDDMPAEVRSRCELYVWPREKRTTDARGRSGSLHAKCAVADGRLLFVGSSNLTEFAFELNIELGLLVRAPDVTRVVEDQLHWLLASGTMQRI